MGTLPTNPLTQGADLTSFWTAGYATTLMAWLQNSTPSVGSDTFNAYGYVILADTPPDVSGANAWRKSCTWIDTSFISGMAPPRKWISNYYNQDTASWTNSSNAFAPNSITTAMIQNGAVTPQKIAGPGSVDGYWVLSSNMAGTLPQWVAGDTLFLTTLAGAVGTTNIADGAITTAKIGAQQVQPGNIQLVSINSGLMTTIMVPGSYGDSTHVPVVTCDIAGRITNITPVAINFPAPPTVPPTFGRIWATSALTSSGTTTLALSFALPASQTWAYVRIFARLDVSTSLGGAGNASVTFQWNCGSLLNTAVTVSSSTGAGNSGQNHGVAANNTDSPIWAFEGVIPGAINNQSTLIIQGVLASTVALTGCNWQVWATVEYHN